MSRDSLQWYVGLIEIFDLGGTTRFDGRDNCCCQIRGTHHEVVGFSLGGLFDFAYLPECDISMLVTLSCAPTVCVSLESIQMPVMHIIGNDGCVASHRSGIFSEIFATR